MTVPRHALLIFTGSLLLLSGWPALPAAAHARLLRVDPAPGAVLARVPAVVRLWFNEELDPALSSVTVWGPRAVSVISGKGGVDLDDLDRKSMIARLRPLRPGTYTVRWRAATADDLAVTQGTYTFVVRP